MPAPLHRQEAALHSLSEDMRARGLEPSSKLSRGEVRTESAGAAALGLPPPPVMIERVKYADGVAVALETAALPGEFASVLEADLERGSLHQALADLGREMGRATGYLTARMASSDEARLLELEMPAALLVEARLIRDVSNRPTENTRTAHVASRWAIDTGVFVAALPPDVVRVVTTGAGGLDDRQSACRRALSRAASCSPPSSAGTASRKA